MSAEKNWFCTSLSIVTHAGENYNLVVQLEGKADWSGAYLIDGGIFDQANAFSTEALLMLLGALEQGEFQVSRQEP